jgi:2-octaprenyl-6-methoxyphenol hydroxylase
MDKDYQAIVVGAGPAGLAAGLAFAHLGLRAAVVGPVSDPNDGRTAALFEGSIELLRRIGAWDNLKDHSEPLKAIRLIDATGGLLRAPEVTFWAHEIGLDAFGYNVPTGGLTVALESVAAGRLSRLQSAGVERIDIEATSARVVTREGVVLTAPLIAGADGRNSLARQAAHIETQRWAYPQAAVVATFSHSRDHQGISTELHRRCGPLTVVPMPGRASSLVWVDTPEEAARLAALSDDAFNSALKAHVGGLLGTMRDFSPRRVFPLSGQTATVLGRNRVGLIGESGHIIPPIGAQGLNLSLRDRQGPRRGGCPGGLRGPAAPGCQRTGVDNRPHEQVVVVGVSARTSGARGRYCGAQSYRSAAASRHARGHKPFICNAQTDAPLIAGAARDRALARTTLEL